MRKSVNSLDGRGWQKFASLVFVSTVYLVVLFFFFVFPNAEMVCIFETVEVNLAYTQVCRERLLCSKGY